MRRVLASFAGLFLFNVLVLAAPKDAADSADQQWQALKNKGEPASSSNASDDKGRSQAIATLVADADALREFYTQNPSHPEAKQAKRREALSLLYARSLGDQAQKGRCKQLVKDLRKDGALSVEEREQLAAFSDNLDIEEQDTAADKRLGAYEQAARALQAEFPGSISVYESLNGIALSSADDRAATIAQDILRMPAPDQQKALAQVLLNRLALKGTSLVELADAALGPENPVHFGSGHPVIVYAWSSALPRTIALIKTIAPSLPADTAFVGVCLDLGDQRAAHARADADQPLGTQLYDGMGFMGKFAGRAQLTTPGLIYVADRKGVLVSVSAQHDLQALIQIVSNL